MGYKSISKEFDAMKILSRGIGLLVLTAVFWSSGAPAAEPESFSTEPVDNGGKTWRIAYYEGGPYVDYRKYLIGIANGLMELGWLERAELPPLSGETTDDVWRRLVDTAKSPYLRFLEDGHYSAGWDEKRREEVRARLIDRLNKADDIDLVIAAGTWAGQDLANDRHDTPTIVVASNDPVSAGIVKKASDSGYDHVHARVDPDRYKRQVSVFHDLIGFSSLGLVYEDSVEGRSIAAVEDVETIAGERGFTVVPCLVESESGDLAADEAGVRDCFRKLVKTAEAIYVAPHSGINRDTIPDLAKIAYENGIPTFSQTAASEVKAGFLMSIPPLDFNLPGLFSAQTIAKVFNGAKPRQIGQIYEAPPKIAINLKTADLLGLEITTSILKQVDEVYDTIGGPE